MRGENARLTPFHSTRQFNSLGSSKSQYLSSAIIHLRVRSLVSYVPRNPGAMGTQLLVCRWTRLFQATNDSNISNKNDTGTYRCRTGRQRFSLLTQSNWMAIHFASYIQVSVHYIFRLGAFVQLERLLFPDLATRHRSRYRAHLLAPRRASQTRQAPSPRPLRTLRLRSPSLARSLSRMRYSGKIKTHRPTFREPRRSVMGGTEKVMPTFSAFNGE